MDTTSKSSATKPRPNKSVNRGLHGQGTMRLRLGYLYVESPIGVRVTSAFLVRTSASGREATLRGRALTAHELPVSQERLISF